MPRSLVVLRDDTARPILDAIEGATSSLRVRMFGGAGADKLVLGAAGHGHEHRHDGKQHDS